MTCKHAQEFLGPAGTEVKERVDATKVRIDCDAALALLKGIERLVAMKGKKVVVFDLKESRPDDDALLDHMMGPTGNLRAPTARVGTTLLVGFNESAYEGELSE
jgi:hypothetical protein